MQGKLMKSILTKNSLILGSFAFVCAAIVGWLYQQTKAQIAWQEQQVIQQRLDEVLPRTLYDNNLLKNCYWVQDPRLGRQRPQQVFIAQQAETIVAYAIQTTAPDGYSGNIDILLAATPEGQILGVRTLAHQETPGLGDGIDLDKSNWVLQLKRTFDNSDLSSWFVKKDGGMFDQFTGATITPRAYLKAIRNTMAFLQQHQSRLDTVATPCE
jgi:electron transport complex protein RnfG